MRNYGQPLPTTDGGTGAKTAPANQVFAGPTSGAAAAPGFRALGAADMASIISTALALMNGTAAAGSTGKAADAGHIHPSDTSRLAAASNLSDLQSIAAALGNLGFAYTASGNAWVLKIPFGGRTWILQGNVNSVFSDTNISFPNAFPNACVFLSPMHILDSNRSQSSTQYSVAAGGLNASYFGVSGRQVSGSPATVSAFTGGLNFYYFAVGY